MRRRTQRGSSLPEVLVAMTIVSLVFIAIVMGFLTTVRSSNSIGRQARLEAALSTMANRAAAVPYERCATRTALDGEFAAQRRPAGFEAAVVGVRYLAADGSFVDTCSTDRGAQLVTIEVGPTGGSRTLRAEVVLRDRGARAASP